jgi:hypothetical protein
MRLLPFVLVLVIAAQAFAARSASPAPPPGDPLQSPACLGALEALQAQEATLAAAPPASGGAHELRRPAVGAGLEASRRRATRACLASSADPQRPLPPPGRLAQPPIAVPPLGAARLAAPPVVLPGTPALPPQPRFVTSCDPGGCWTSDGSRVNRVGPTLWGSRGACITVGTVTQCP